MYCSMDVGRSFKVCFLFLWAEYPPRRASRAGADNYSSMNSMMPAELSKQLPE